jgi:TRAP-type uncharacterized transport system fused permease subunit
MTTPLDNFVALVGIICVLEITRRATPPALFIITLACIAYVLLGPYIPGELGHRGYSFARLVQYLYLSQEGVFGMAMGVMDENLIYSLTKAFWENIDEFHKSHVLAKTVIQKTFMRGMTIPLHKGAERYYKEMGWIQ